MIPAAPLLDWASGALRDLPWRRTRDPWAILVSELMLQQTQVARVLPRYERFLADLPTPTACARVATGEVVRRWAGLGYNRRAVHLHQAAVVVHEQHGGALPASLPALRSLPGVGPYTARAVLAFAFEHDGTGVVDTNIGRVLARTAGRPLRPAEAQANADRQVPAGRSWLWNQGLMELGATLCTARTPACERCPIMPECAWARAGRPAPDPATGSAGVSGGQPRFEGSDRQGRGRLVHALRHGPVPTADLATVMGWPGDPARAWRVADGVVADGLAAHDGMLLRLA